MTGDTFEGRPNTELEQFQVDLAHVFGEVSLILTERHQGYGSGNLLEDEHVGIAIRMKDKCARIINLTSHPQFLPTEQLQAKRESIRDAYLDLIGYAANGLLMLEGKLKP